MSAGKSFLRITRVKESYGLMRGLVVRINGEKVGSIAAGKTFEIELAPAEYSVQVRMDWCSSQPFIFELYPGQILQLEASLNGGVSRASFYTYFKPNHVFLLTPTTDKYR